MIGLFRRKPRDDGRSALVEDLKRKLREQLGLHDDDALTISEIVCPDISCPGTETIVLVMRAGRKTAALKIAGAMAEIEDEDISSLALPD